MTKSAIGPRGWHAGRREQRFADVAPSSFDAATRTVNAIISMGSPVARFYGTETLRISPEAVGLDRMKNGSQIPLLDSHKSDGISSALGRLTKTWFNRGALMGTLQFNETPNGELAMGMVERGEIAGISAGYCVREWEISDDAGNIVDPEGLRWDDDLTFTATKWDLLEASLVSVPADHLSGIRSMMGSGVDRAMIIGGGVADVRQRMLSRHRMLIKQRMHEAQARVIGRK
jgi:phage head maturation protease